MHTSNFVDGEKRGELAEKNAADKETTHSFGSLILLIEEKGDKETQIILE